VCNLSLAENVGQKDADGNRPTQWFDATLWGKRAEALAQYLVKGSVHCFTLDEVHLEVFTRADNTTGTKLACRVLDVELGPRVNGENGTAQAPRQAAPAAGAKPKPKAPPADMDDDIPF
jgi:single-strand DNA-binding protein